MPRQQFDPIENPVRPGTNVDAEWYRHDDIDRSFW